MRKFFNMAIAGLLGFICISMHHSCTKYDTPDIIRMDGFDSDSVISTAIHRKVLWVNLDGAVGSIVEKTMPTGGTIAKMLKHSKYSWMGLSDDRVLPKIENEDPVTWTTMLTGVIPEKHLVTDNSYVANVEYNPSNPYEKVIQYPTILNYIAESNYKNPTLCVTPWEKLNKNMLKAAQKRVTTTNDEETRDVVLQNLTKSDFDFILVSFSGMLEAGKSGGFKESNPDYLSALQRIDGYLGEFMQAIDERKNAFFEDWLIIVTSNHGGTPDGRYGGNSAAERNTFCIFYYSHYDEKKMVGEKLYGAYLDGIKTQAIVFDTISDITKQQYAMFDDKEFAFEVVMRLLPKRDGTYGNGVWGRLFGKHNWGLYRQYGTYTDLYVPGIQPHASNIFLDPLFHSVTATFSKRNTSNGLVSWKYATNGTVISSGDNNLTYTSQPLIETENQRISFQNSSRFIIGGTSSIVTPYYISELRLWRMDIPIPMITELGRMTNIPETYPYYNNLIGYWKFHPDEVIGTSTDGDTIIIRNKIRGGLDMYYINNKINEIRETRFVELSNTLPHKIKSGDIIFENTLVVPQIMYWLNLSTNTVLDGFRFIDNYAYSEDWRDLPEE